MPAGHYFSAAPDAPSRPSQVELRLPDAVVSLTVDRGVFSGTRVDPGTVALLRTEASPAAAGHLLDLGCGYGPIACTLARRAPATTVWAVDVNQRALSLTRTNAASLGLANVVPAEPDAVPGDLTFTEIWSNPPIRIGKDALHSLLDRWLARLAPGGRALLVVHRHLGGDSLADWLARRGWVVRRQASKQGYRVLDVRRLEARTGAADPEQSGQTAGGPSGGVDHAHSGRTSGGPRTGGADPEQSGRTSGGDAGAGGPESAARP